MTTALLDMPAWATATLTGADDRPYLAPGAQTEADALINRLGDGTRLEVVYEEITSILADINAYKGGLASLLAFSTTSVAEAIPQSMTAERFQPATEFGLPTAVGQDPVALLAFDFDDHDLRSSFSWKYLRSASLDQVRNAFVRVLEADNNLVVGTILRRLFDNTEDVEQEWGHKVYPILNGTGPGALPYLGKTFPANHNHFIASGANAIDSGDVQDAMRLVTEHGYGITPGSKLLILANPQESEIIQSFRAGVQNNNTQVAKYDFIPSAAAPPFMTDKHVVGEVAPDTYAGLEVAGQYGRGLLIEHNLVPAGYFAVVATGGPNGAGNIIGYREHELPEWRGLRIIPGYRTHPVIDAYYQRSFGTGVRHRAGAAVFQITSGSTYTVPAIAI